MITAYTDGGARGNPGPAGYGVHIIDEDGQTLAELVGPLGRATNNVAEYSGLIAALRWALEHGHDRVRVRMDSELVIKQMRGEYKVKNAGLQPLYADASQLASRLGRVIYEHVRREQNKVADGLSNAAMDESEGKPPRDARVGAAAHSSAAPPPAASEPRAPRAIAIPRPAKPGHAAAQRPAAPRFDFDLD